MSSKKSRKPMKLHFKESNGPVDRRIHDLMEMVGDVHHPQYIREMILCALKAGQEGMNRADLKLMNTTLKEMRFTGKIFGPYRGTRKVTVFGSARTRPEDPAYETAVLFGQKLREAGYMVITGGGPGIMQAVNEGAGTDHSFGVNIRLPFEQKSNPVLAGSDKSIVYKYFFNRKVAFLKEAHAVALFPGGFGTLDEAMETLTLVQTGKRDLMPLVLIDPPGSVYWQRWLEFLKTQLMEHQYIGPEDFHLFDRVESVDDAVAMIDRFYRRFHSLRYVNGRLVIRMNTPVSGELVKELSVKYADILGGGGMELSGALDEEQNEPEIQKLPRLLLDFDRHHFGRLRKLVDDLNDAPAA
jgi:uncharacterized protein (TIGR00730 family)